MAPSCLPLQSAFTHRTKLWDLQQGDARNNGSISWMETPPIGSQTDLRNLDRSPKSTIFLTTSKTELLTSPLGHRASRLWLYFTSQTRQTKSTGGFTIQIFSRLWDLATKAGIGTLKQWIHDQKQWEVNKDLIQLLLNIPTNKALDWLEDLHEPKWFVFRTTKKTDQELNLQIKLQDLEKGTKYQTQALLDSGCTGSCISQRFVEEKKLSLHKWEHPISAYNTDGTEKLHTTLN